MNPPDYLNPNIPADMKRVSIPVVEATNESLKGYGCVVDSPDDFKIAIVRWPAKGWRPVDSDTGDEAGTTEGVFVSEWRGDIIYGRMKPSAVITFLAMPSSQATPATTILGTPKHLLLWHANYHPDGGQLFFPLDRRPFIVPLALPGDDVRPEQFVCFQFDGSCGLYIHPDVWHEGVFALGTQRFFDKQGRVHARVSVDFPREFGCLLDVDLHAVQSSA